MPIPGPYDAKLGEIESTASGILVQLSTMRRANPRDVDRMRAMLRQSLQDYADLVIALANEGAG